jgi:hypothetical protein
MAVIWQATTIGNSGTPEGGVSVEVREESDNSLSVIYSDYAGTVIKDNPFLSDSNGYAFFYTTGGRFKITASKGGYETVWRNVLVNEYATARDLSDGIAEANGYTDEEVYSVHGEVVSLEVDVELNKEIWKDQDGVEHKLWISEDEPDDEYDGEDGDIWFKTESVS